MRTTVQIAALYLCLGVLAAQTCNAGLRIPRLLHRNFMAGAAALYEAANDPQSGFQAHWLASCKVHNPDWQEIIWDAKAVDYLIEQDFPWFLPTYLTYPKLVQRSDVTRYMVLYKYGGVYLDADVECYSPLEASLMDKDLVLNCEWPQKQAQIHNAAMASAPGHPFWLAMLQEAMLRAPSTVGFNLPNSVVGHQSFPDVASSDLARRSSSNNEESSKDHSPQSSNSRTWNLVDLLSIQNVIQGVKGIRRILGVYQRRLKAKLQGMWELTLFHDKVNAVLWSTGPMLLTDVYKKYSGSVEPCGVSVEVGCLTNHVYELGSWFTPCFFRDSECQSRWITQHFLLTRNQTQHQQRQQEQQQQQPVVGIHHYSASWTDWDKSSKQQQRQQLEQEASQHVWEFLHGPFFLQYNCSVPLLPQPAASSSSGSSSGGGSGGELIPLCMEVLLDAISSDTCAVVTVFVGNEQQQIIEHHAEAAGAVSKSDIAPTAAAAAQEEAVVKPDSVPAGAAAGGLTQCSTAGAVENVKYNTAAATAAGTGNGKENILLQDPTAAAGAGDGGGIVADYVSDTSATAPGVCLGSSSSGAGSSRGSCSGSSSSSSGSSGEGSVSSSSSRSCHLPQAEQNESAGTQSAGDTPAVDRHDHDHDHCSAAAAAAAAARAGHIHALSKTTEAVAQDMIDLTTEQLLHTLGCHVTALSEDSAWLVSAAEQQQQQQPSGRGGWQQLHGSLGIGSAGVKQQHTVPQQQQQGSPAAVGVVTLHELLRLADRKQQQQQGSSEPAARASSANQELPTRFVLRVVCSVYDLHILLQALTNNNETSATLATPLHQVEVLVLDLRTLKTRPGIESAQARNKKCSNSSKELDSKPPSDSDTCDDNANSGGSGVDNAVQYAGLGLLYDVLYQQHGFVGYYRQQLAGGVLRLGWVRQPYRMKATETVDSRDRERLLLQRLLNSAL